MFVVFRVFSLFSLFSLFIVFDYKIQKSTMLKKCG